MSDRCQVARTGRRGGGRLCGTGRGSARPGSGGVDLVVARAAVAGPYRATATNRSPAGVGHPAAGVPQRRCARHSSTRVDMAARCGSGTWTHAAVRKCWVQSAGVDPGSSGVGRRNQVARPTRNPVASSAAACWPMVGSGYGHLDARRPLLGPRLAQGRVEGGTQVAQRAALAPAGSSSAVRRCSAGVDRVVDARPTPVPSAGRTSPRDGPGSLGQMGLDLWVAKRWTSQRALTASP